MVNDPLVSIITPTYNHEKFIAQCLESVLSQTYSNWEQIVIDDGSSDRTQEIVLGYKDKRIRYIRQENKGIWKLGELYNNAVGLSQGKYIAILEGDDFWPPDKLELQMKAMECSDAILSWGKAKVIDEDGEFLMVFPEDINRFIDLSKEQYLGELLFKNSMHSCTIICRKSSLLSIGGFKQPPGAPYVDGATWLELSLLGTFLPIDAVLGCYRRHEKQISSTLKTSMIKSGLYSIEFFNNLPADIKTSLAENIDDLNGKLERRSMELYYYLGRAYLENGKRHQALVNFLKAFRRGNSSIRAKAMLGIVCSLCGTDLERLAAFYDKKTSRDTRIH